MRSLISAALLCAVGTAAPAAALEVHIKDVTAESTMLRASIELRDVVPDRFRRLLDENRTLHLRVQAELWESRPIWDRLVYPAVVRAVRMTKDTVTSGLMPFNLDLGNRDRIVATGRYYLHVIATIGTIAERDVEEVGDAVFGRPSETNTLGSLGRAVVRAAVQVSDYLQSVSSETKSKKLSGADLLKP